jgi:hypothetical protein
VNQYIVFNPQVAARITSASEAYTLNGENGGSLLIAGDGEIIASPLLSIWKLRTWQKVAKRVVHMCKPASQHNSCGIAKK